jgi:tRNA pseudouridine13 synthase
MRVGHFEYVDTDLRLGSLQGNHFEIVLRNVQVKDKAQTREILQRATEALQATGFINYFGMQRFGKSHDTHLTGLEVVKGNYKEAIHTIMRPKVDEKDDINKARQKWADRFRDVAEKDYASAEQACAKDVIRAFGRFATSETTILNSLIKTPLDYKRAFQCIAKNLRMMFLHALQSYMWNRAATLRIESMGATVQKGDLVLTDGTNSSVKTVMEEDLASNAYTIHDVVLPLVGPTTVLPQNESASMFHTILTEQGLTMEMLTKSLDRDLNSAGDYRKLICRPTDVSYDVVEYTNPLCPLIQTDLMKINNVAIEAKSDSAEPEDVLLAMVVRFTLPSSAYATMALRELMKRPTNSDYQRKLMLSTRPLGSNKNKDSGDNATNGDGNDDAVVEDDGNDGDEINIADNAVNEGLNVSDSAEVEPAAGNSDVNMADGVAVEANVETGDYMVSNGKPIADTGAE